MLTSDDVHMHFRKTVALELGDLVKNYKNNRMREIKNGIARESTKISMIDKCNSKCVSRGGSSWFIIKPLVDTLKRTENFIGRAVMVGPEERYTIVTRKSISKSTLKLPSRILCID